MQNISVPQVYMAEVKQGHLISSLGINSVLCEQFYSGCVMDGFGEAASAQCVFFIVCKDHTSECVSYDLIAASKQKLRQQVWTSSNKSDDAPLRTEVKISLVLNRNPRPDPPGATAV